MQRDLGSKTIRCLRIVSSPHILGLMALAVLLSFIVMPVWADGTVDEQKPSESVIVTPLANTTEKTGLYDIDATGTDIRFVLEALARCSGANIVISPEITGEITAHLKQTSVDQILAQLSVVQGFGWQKNADAYLVANKDKFVVPSPQKEEVKPPDTTVFVWQCRYLKPDEAATTIQKLFPNVKVSEGPGSVTPTLDTNSNGLASLEGNVNRVPSSANSMQNVNSSSNTVVLVGSQSDIDKVKEALQTLDVGRSQVRIKVAIIEISSSAKRDLGVTWSYSDIKLAEAAPASGIGFGKFGRQGLSFLGTISALAKNGNAKLLAEPSISVLDSECASILIGDRILFPKLVGYSQVGTPIYDKEEERVGIYLQISAKVTNPDEVIMTVYPQVSLVTGYLKTQAGDYPQISTREARTTVSVKSDEPLVIGGLVRDDEIRDVSKIPLLGNLPIIGQFFRHSTKTKEHNEIVIVLTPTISCAK